MDDTKKRTITKETLSKALQKMNPQFIEELPDTPENLLLFARRRVEPVISDNISYSLGQSMLEHRLSDEDYLITFFKVLQFVFAGKSISDSPRANVLISQTGAGKSNLRELLKKENPGLVVINSDQYKKFRPDVKEILREDPTHFGALTGIDCYDHSSNVVEFAMHKGYDLLIECAPSKQQGLVGVDLARLKEMRYDTKFHVLAVGDLISALAIHSRYEQDIRLGLQQGETKLTDLKRHNESYEAADTIVENLIPRNTIIYKRGDRYYKLSTDSYI